LLDVEGSIRAERLSQHQLIAALRAGAVLDESGTDPASLESSYLRLPTEGLFAVEALRSGGNLLRALGLIVEEDGRLFREARLDQLLATGDDLACRLLLAIALERVEPLWLHAAAGRDGGVANEFIPDDMQHVLSSVVRDPEEREAMLLALANKFDSTGHSETGDLGERHVVTQCRAELTRLGRPDLVPAVRQVSLISDQLGYDVVTPDAAGSILRLEVKTTRRPATRDVSFFLSRNEAQVAVRDAHWRLVACRIDEGGVVTTIGSCPGGSLTPIFPADSNRGRWTAASLVMAVADLVPGLPSLTGDTSS
jgi:hypothetical protein